MGLKIIDTLIFVFFVISIVFFTKNLTCSKYNLETIKVYKDDINNLRRFLTIEKSKSEKLKRKYIFLQELKKQNIKAYIRDYLFMTEPATQIYRVKR